MNINVVEIEKEISLELLIKALAEEIVKEHKNGSNFESNQ
jgi:hypothetical protein